MGLSITNNVASLNAQHNLNRASSNVAKSVERLSSGLKINRGADGPAALVISEKQRAQIAGLNQAIDNTDKAVSVVQTAEGALNEINSLLVKVRSLAIDSANSGVNDSEALAANQAEITNVLETIDRIATNTQFGSKKLLDGSASAASTGVATDSDLSAITATKNTKGGSYAVNVTTAAEKAKATGAASGVSGTSTLSGVETLTVTGSTGTATVTLAAGLDQAGILAAVNAKTSETGVVAEVDPAESTKIRFTSSKFGSAESISVVSDTATTGFKAAEVSGTSGGILGADETLTIEGGGNPGSPVTVSLSKDDTLALAVLKINDTKGTTGVEAFLDPSDNTKIRFKSLTAAGPGSSISVVSDKAATTYAATTTAAGSAAKLTAGGTFVAPGVGTTETLTINGGNGDIDIVLDDTDDIDSAIVKINAEQGSTGVVASKDTAGTSLVFTSTTNSISSTFTVVSDVNAGGSGVSDTVLTANGTGFTAPGAGNTEVITINGGNGNGDIDITLDSTDDIDSAIAKINNEQFTTGVLASKDLAGTSLIFTSKDTSYSSTFTVVSNVTTGGSGISDTVVTANGKASSGIGQTALASQGSLSSGVGTSALTDSGVDIAGTIDGVAATGARSVLTATTGDAKDLSFTVGADSDASNSVTGDQGTVTVADNSLVFQIGANQNQTAKIGISNVKSGFLGTGISGNQFANLGQIDVTSADKAQDSLAVIDAAISNITNLRGDLGAFQSNTLESTANNLRVTLENTVKAESVIRDTDFASEIAAFTKNQVLVQAGSSMLSNANQIPQLVLSLLR